MSASLNTSRSQLGDIRGKDSYSFVSVDSQHSPYNEGRLLESCVTAEEAGIPVQFCIKHTRHAYMIGNILDLENVGLNQTQRPWGMY